MYNSHANGLGEVPAAAEPSLWDSFANLLTKGATAGFNIYNKVQTMTQQQKAATAAQEQAKQMAAYAQIYGQPTPGVIPGRPMYGQPTYGQAYGQSSDFLGGWTMPLLIGSVAIAGIFLLKKK